MTRSTITPGVALKQRIGQIDTGLKRPCYTPGPDSKDRAERWLGCL
jgi:hypothetical protein